MNISAIMQFKVCSTIISGSLCIFSSNQKQDFLIFAVATFSLLSLGLGLPTSDDMVNNLERRDGYTLWVLVILTSLRHFKSISPKNIVLTAGSYCLGDGMNAIDCTNNFGTQCDDNGLIVNEVAPTAVVDDCNFNIW